MGNVSTANKQIAKNTIFLYIRMVVVMLVGLYTSRVLLQNLGVEDFGIYGLVGGVVSMFATLKTMFTVAIQRFLNIELGRGDDKELNKVFNVSILVNLVIAAAFLVIVEAGGLWLLENKLKIAPERMAAANWVFQFSVIAAILAIINAPYNSDIIAHEKMNVYAILSIFEVFAKLAIILLLPVVGGDRLIVYGLLMLFISIIHLAVSIIYCRAKFHESKIIRYPFAEIRSKFKEMFVFSGWAFFGNVVFTLVNEGINVLLNIFGSVVANASRTIAYQVRGTLSQIVTNVYVAIKPQAIQSYAKKDTGRFYNLMFTGAKIVGYMYILLAIPLYFTLDEILGLWLGTVPEYAVSFLTAIFIYQFVRVLHESVDTFFVTIGRLKEYQITEFFALGSALPLAYIGLKFLNMPLYGVFIVMTFSEIVNLVAILLWAKKIGGYDIRKFFTTVIVPYLGMTIICFISVFLLKFVLSPIDMNSTVKAFVLIALAVIVQLIWLYLVGLRKEEKNIIITLIIRRKK